MARSIKILAVVAILVAGALASARYLSNRTPPVSTGPGAESGRPSPGGELVASSRTDVVTYNRYASRGSTAATDLLTLLTQATLVRVDRTTDEVVPWLGERWTTAPDGMSYTIALRPGLRFSDGAEMSAADVLFTLRMVYDPRVGSPLADALRVNGKPLEGSAPDPRTVVLRFPEPFAPGLRILDSLPILPRHKLEAALDKGTLDSEWHPSRPLTDVAGLGPFVLSEHISGQRLVLLRNPHYFRRDDHGTQLPYLDRLTIRIAPDQNAEALRLEAGEVDLVANGDIRAQDYAGFKALADRGRLVLLDAGISLDADFLAFNLRPSRAADPRASWLSSRGFRQAVSCGVDRQAIVNTVYLGAAVPILGGVTPGNVRWHAPLTAGCSADPARARQLLTAAGLADADGNGTLEDRAGRPARFSILTQGGHLRERVVSILQQQLGQLGLAVDVVSLDPGGIFQRWSKGDYDAIYFGLQASSPDPALNQEFWRSSGQYHFWNPAQPTPATEWERRIDALMDEQARSQDDDRRRAAFAEVQRILAEELPLVYFVAPKIMLATSARVRNPRPAPQVPQLLWAADSLASAAR